MRAKAQLQRTVARTTAIALIGATFCLIARAQSVQLSGKPQITNAKAEEREVKAGLAQEVDVWAAAAEKAQWLGYSVPAVAGDHKMCCGDSGGDWNGGRGCGPCQLEGSRGGNNYNLQSGDVKLEGASSVVVLLRAEGRKIQKIRVVSENCVLDAGGLQITWLTGVKAADSVKLLERFVDGKELDEHGGNRLSRGALMAIAMHGDASADQAMAGFAAPDKPEAMRKRCTSARRFCAVHQQGKQRGGRNDSHGARGRKRSRARAGTVLAGTESRQEGFERDYRSDRKRS